jgi:hypothetical protein
MVGSGVRPIAAGEAAVPGSPELESQALTQMAIKTRPIHLDAKALRSMHDSLKADPKT